MSESFGPKISAPQLKVMAALLANGQGGEIKRHEKVEDGDKTEPWRGLPQQPETS